MRSVLTICAFFVLSSIAFGAATPGPSETFDWVAYPEVGNPELINPAGFVYLHGLRLRIGIAASDSTVEGFDRISVAFPGAGISGWWNDDQSMRRFTVSSGSYLFDRIAAVGIGYSWYDPTVDGNLWSDRHSITLGMVIRPNESFSFGFVRTGSIDLPGDDDVEARYRAGFAFRPFGEDLTLTANFETETDLEDQYFSAGVEVRPLAGLSVRADAGSDHLSLGLEVGFGTSSFSSGGSTDSEFSYTGSRADVILSTNPGPNLLVPADRFIRFDVEDMDELRRRPFLGSIQPCFTETALLLDRIASDPSVSGVILDMEGPIDSPAQAEEIRYLLDRIAASGKKIYVYLEDAGNGEYYIAACADGIWVHPCGRIAFIGLHSESFFLREFLDSIGIYPDLLHIGDYKSASDMLTRTEMSDAQREATTELLETLQSVLVYGVMDGRGLEPAQINAILNAGPFTPQGAVTAGMVDGVCYQDEVEDRIRDRFGMDFTSVSLRDYASDIPSPDVWGPEGHVAVVIAEGIITSGGSGTAFPLGRILGSDDICRTIEEAASQPGVAALVLRIDSPGGSALASADIHHTLEIVNRDIPVVVSMGGVAASGGYYIACGADRIFADRMTVTGSIGIISGKFSLQELTDNLGINVEDISTAPMSSMYSSFRPYSEAERSIAYELMEDGYNLFVETVARGRIMTAEEVDSIGQGRVWSGEDGVEIGIVDENGGVVDAVKYAAHLAGIDYCHISQIMIYPTPSFPGEITLPGSGVSSEFLEVLGSDHLLFLLQPSRIR